MREGIVGEWVGMDNNGVPINVLIHRDSRLRFSVGKDKAEGTWRLEESTDLVQLDFHLHTDDHLTMRMIARLVSKDALQIRIDDSNSVSRPTEFLSKDDNDKQLTLKRKQPGF